ncbi:MAG: hypothetical protein AB1349_01310 [Elusimicrobiota bacterium]
MNKNFYLLLYTLYFILYTAFTGCSIYPRRQKFCKVIFSEKQIPVLKSIAVCPVAIGFPTGVATEFIPLVKSPFVIEDKSKKWFNNREERMIVDRETAEKTSRITSEHLYNILLKRKKFDRIVHPDSVKNVIMSKKVNLGEIKQAKELNTTRILEKLFVVADKLKVDGLIFGIIKKCETAISYKTFRSDDKSDFGEYKKSINYSYKFQLEIGVYSTSEKKIVWIGESRTTKSKATPELEQNLLIAVATNKLDQFLQRYLMEKILKEEPEYQCVLQIVNTLPF